MPTIFAPLLLLAKSPFYQFFMLRSIFYPSAATTAATSMRHEAGRMRVMIANLYFQFVVPTKKVCSLLRCQS
jgi:hypothetical protein